jgi:predicted O-methyltransferase YrrM
MDIAEFFPAQNIGSILKDDADVLVGIVKKLKPKKIVEIGTFVGASTIIMALALKENGFGKLYTVDQNDHQVMLKAKEYRVEDYIEFTKGKSEDFVDAMTGQIDFVFYDGNAAESSYKYHFDVLWPKLRQGGVYAIHDYKTRSKGHQAFLSSISVPYRVEDTSKGITIIEKK